MNALKISNIGQSAAKLLTRLGMKKVQRLSRKGVGARSPEAHKLFIEYDIVSSCTKVQENNLTGLFVRKMIQSTTSTAGLITFSEANKGIKTLGGLSTCTVFDSAEFEVPMSRAAEAVEMLYYYFNDWPVENFDWLDLPIGCEVEISNHSWGRCEGVHRGTTQEQIEAMFK